LIEGFQVLLTAYPEAQRTLDYHALELKEVHARRTFVVCRQDESAR
jgi:hypothetical protein